MTAKNDPGAAVFDPFSPSFIHDPYPVYAQLRSEDPVHRSPMGFWVLTRYADVNQALNDQRLSNRPSRFAVTHERNREKYTAADVANNIIPFQDAPRHTRARRLISKAFFAQLRDAPPPISERCERLLAASAGSGRMELVEQYATPLAIGVIADLLGLPETDHDRLRAWSHDFFYLFAPIPSPEVLAQLNRSLTSFRQYLQPIVNERRTKPQNDLISRLILAEDAQGDSLGDPEIIDSCMLLFSDGVENVDSAIASCVQTFVRHDALARLAEFPEQLAPAIQEALRLDSPGQFIAKVARQDIEWAGKTIKANDAVLLVLASANQDEQVFDRPDEFFPDRAQTRHLAFGRGHHACIGAPLVEQEIEVAIKALLKRCANLRVVEPELQWQARMGHRWLKQLPIAFDPPGRR